MNLSLVEELPEFVAGLAHVGCEGDKEIYQLPFAIPLSTNCLKRLKRLAQHLDAHLETTPRLCIYKEDQALLEICDSSIAYYLLVPTDYKSKLHLLQSAFEALIFGSIIQRNYLVQEP